MSSSQLKRGLIVALAVAATTIGVSPLASGQSGPQVWNTVKQKILAGEPVTARRVGAGDASTYCSVASTPGTDFVWTDMVHSGLEYAGAWAMWAAPCPAAVARIRGAEIIYQKVVNFVNHAVFRPPHPSADELAAKEVLRATEGGAMVIMINVENAAQAQQVVRRVYYPPIGTRPLGPGQFNDVYPASVTGGNYLGTYNDNVVVIGVISTVGGVSQAKTIAAVPGVHALYLDVMSLESDSGYARGAPDFTKLESFVRVSALASKKYICLADRSANPNTLTCSKS